MKKALTYLGKIELVGLLWLVFSVPIVTAGVSTTAAYYTMVKVIRRNTGTIWEEFIRSFRENAKDGLLLTVIMEILVGLLGFNMCYFYLYGHGLVFFIAYFSALVLLMLVGMLQFLWPALSRFAISKKQLVEMSFQMSVKHIFSTIVLDVFLICVVYGVYCFLFLIVLLPGIWMFFQSLLVERILQKYMPEVDELELEADMWYNQTGI